MKARWGCATVLVLLACRPVRPDTITMKDNLSINGSLLEMSNGLLKIEAQFPSQEKEVWIRVDEVGSIEFNLLTFNPGAPPKILGFGPPTGQNPPPKPLSTAGVIVLRGGRRQPCELAGIDAENIRCGPTDASYDRNAVLRIVFASK